MDAERTNTANPNPARARSARRGGAALAALTLAGLAGLTSAPAAQGAEGAEGTQGAATRPAVAHRADRGALLDVTPVADLSRAEVAAFLRKGEFGTETVRYGVRAYRLTYRTVDTEGRPTTATGLFVLPRTDSGTRRHRALDLVSDARGTMVHRDYAPSVAEDSGRLSPYLHAAAGKAVAAPDYLGLGKGPGVHPYMDARSAVTASEDMLRASRTAAQHEGRTLSGDLYLTGFSQGGQVTMALAREADRGLAGFTLRAVAPVSGPHDLSGEEFPALFDGRVNDTSAVFYLSYFLVAQNRLHPIYKDPSDVFRAPYADRIERLFDGGHTEEEVLPALPETLKELLTPAFHERMQQPTGGLKEALAANDGFCDWKPAAPVRLYAARGDTDVPIQNARSCASALAAHGVRAPVLDQGAVPHMQSVGKAAPKIARWFARVGS
ncbi:MULTISPECIES: alpha/beta hydrolase [unclassified Streptomyces]|nr:MULTISPECIES: alpha/beta hydrolase [unclassified Streptomyces]MYZ16062.1 alpha/beta hydrolase [Streptomyces sp. SID337]NEB43380.1 alpha/beta hydrolase [Streptomyces sp. SID339]